MISVTSSFEETIKLQIVSMLRIFLTIVTLLWTSGKAFIALLISSNSILNPLILIWKSFLPIYTISPLAVHFAKSPVLYKSPFPKGFFTNFLLVNSGLLIYPKETPSPVIHNSPIISIGHKFRSSLQI